MSDPTDRIAGQAPDAGGHVADRVDDYLHNLLDGPAAAEVERHCEACLPCKAALADARRRLAVLHAAPAAEAPERLVRATLGKIDAHEKRRRVRLRRFAAIGAGALAASMLLLLGLHVFTMTRSTSPADLVVLGQRDLLAAANGSLRVLLTDRNGNRPLVGVPVTVQLVDHLANKTVELASFSTDGHGGGQPRFELPDWADNSYELRVVAQTPGGPEVASQSVTLKRSRKVMLTSDKPVYQPGQTIHLRALSLRKADLHPVGGEAATFLLVDPRGNVVFKRGETTSRFGIAAADCILDTEIQEGQYTVECKTADVTSRLAVEVKKYVLPKFKVDVTFDKPFYQPGDVVHCTIQADYFFGKHVAGAAVQVEEWNADAPAALPRVVTARTDADGKATVEYSLLQVPAGVDLHLDYKVVATDSAGQKQTRTASRLVTNQPIRLEVIPEGGNLVQGVPNTIYVLVTHADGRPAPGLRITAPGVEKPTTTDDMGAAFFEYTPPPNNAKSVNLTVVAATDKNDVVAQREVLLGYGTAADDFLLRTDKAVYRNDDSPHLTALGGAGPVFVDFIKDGRTLRTETIDLSGGRGAIDVDLTPDLFGTLEIVGYRITRDSSILRKTRVVYVHPADQLHIAATLAPDRKEYKPGDKPTLTLKLTDDAGKATPGAVSLAGVDEAVFAVLPQPPGAEQAYYTLQPDLLRAVNDIHPWSPKQVTSPAFERALFSSAARNEGGQGRTSMIDDEEVSGVQGESAHTLAVDSYLAKRTAAAELRRERLALLWAGWALLLVGTVLAGLAGFWLLTRFSVAVKALVSGYFVMFFLVAACSGMFGGPHSGPFRQADLNGIAGEEAVAGLPMDASPGIPVGMVGNVEDVQESIKKDTEGKLEPRQGSPHIRVREQFPETLLWKPELITDDDGTVRVPLDLADSITTWRLSAGAVAADGRLGSAELPVKVFKDFFVDLNLPVTMTRNDEVTVPVVVYNYLDKAQTVTLTLADADWCTRIDGAVQKLDLKPGQVDSVRYRLRVDKVGDHTLTVTAQGAADGDAVKRSIEVVPDGRRVEQVVNGTLENPAETTFTVPANRIEGSVKGVVKIYPSSFSQLVEGLDNIFHLPYGCFEQTSSTTYPNVLALDYLRRTHQSAPAVERKAREYIHLGYQRLVGFEVSGGGFDWFGQAPANRTLTAYGLMEFEDIARIPDVGTDPALIERTRRWLLDRRKADGSWDPERHQLHDNVAGGADDADKGRLATTAYIAWAVFSNPSAHDKADTTSVYLKSHKPESIKDPHVLALVCNALLAIHGPGADVEPYLDRLESLKRTDGDGRFSWWELNPGERTTFYGAGRSGSVETTALAALALLRANRHPGTARTALAWLTSQKDASGTWYSTQATVLSLKALLAGTDEHQGDTERVVEAYVDGKLIQTLRIPPDQADVMKQIDLSPALTVGAHQIKLTEKSGAPVGFQAALRYHEPDAGGAKAGPLTIALTYDRTELTVDDQVTAKAEVVNRMDETAAMVMVELPIPPGFIAATDDFADLVKTKRAAKVQVQTRSVLLYLRNLEPAKPLTLTYHLRAALAVKATVPGARVYEYYDPDRQGSSAGAVLTVKSRD